MPAGKRYEALMEEWSTEISGTTDADGLLSFRGFHGDYAATVTRTDGAEANASFSIERGREPQEVTIQLQNASLDDFQYTHRPPRQQVRIDNSDQITMPHLPAPRYNSRMHDGPLNSQSF
jgi:hypothetical protein